MTALHVLGEVLWCPVYLVIAASTEEGDPYVLPRMTIRSIRVFVHYPTVGAEHKLLPLIFAIIDGYPRQAVGLMELMNHILSFRLKQHVWRHDGYQGAISLGFDERAHTGYVPCDPSSGVKGKPLTLKLEIMGLALGNTTIVVKMVNPVCAYDCWRMSLISHPP